MFIGIDIGTSGVKALLTDQENNPIDSETVALPISRPQPMWSEQSPSDWWKATLAAIDALQRRNPKQISELRGIGLAGQMHGAVILDKDNAVIRPAILWNDGRCEAECVEIENKIKESRQITGNIAMPGFTAPKLLWLSKHEPENFAKINKVLLPKDYIRFCLTGDFFSDMSDAAGTLWLDVANRRWSDEMIFACNLSKDQMPTLCEGNDVTGELSPSLKNRWGITGKALLAGGAGDNAAGAIGLGATRDNSAFISLGTSGVYFVGTNQFRACPEKTVHAFCHAIPDTWHQMGVILSAASCISSAANFLGSSNSDEISSLVNENNLNLENNIIFLPYLSGERTPHNNPKATGSFFGLTHNTSKTDLVQSILEGVAFAFADCQDALAAAGTHADEIMLIGGGAKNRAWGKLISNALNKTMVYVADGDQGPAFGAAKLARMAVTGEAVNSIAKKPNIIGLVKPEAKVIDYLKIKLEKYRNIYQQIRPLY